MPYSCVWAKWRDSLREKEKMKPTVCILAHNEGKNIGRTIEAILLANGDAKPLIKVYANGCTDNTHEVVNDWAEDEPNVLLRVIDQAGKGLAWNVAFSENDADVLFFADADVLPEPGSLEVILGSFKATPSLELACCETWPVSDGISLQQRLIGFMQIPYSQDFLTGHFYGIRKKAFVSHFARLNLNGLPDGIVAEDAFIGAMVDPQNFQLVQKKVFYSPPVLDDYFSYLGRIIWQNEQLVHYQKSGLNLPALNYQRSSVSSVGGKIASARGSLLRIFSGSVATTFRILFKSLFRKRIQEEYRKLGPVSEHGSWVLSRATRSSSVK